MCVLSQASSFLLTIVPVHLASSLHRLFLVGVDSADDLINHRWVRKSRCVTELVLLAGQDLSQDSAHDLTTASLGQVWHNVDHLGRREWSNALTDLEDEVLAERVVGLVSFLDRHECVDSLTGQLVGDTNDGRLSYGVVLDERGFDLGRRETVTRYVDDIVDTATNPVVTFVVTSRSITGELSKVSATSLSSSMSPSCHLRSIPCKRSSMCPCISCEHPRRFSPSMAMPA